MSLLVMAWMASAVALHADEEPMHAQEHQPIPPILNQLVSTESLNYKYFTIGRWLDALDEWTGLHHGVATNIVINRGFSIDNAGTILLTDAIYLLIKKFWSDNIRLEVIDGPEGQEIYVRSRKESEPLGLEPYMTSLLQDLGLPIMQPGNEAFLEVVSLTPSSPTTLEWGQRITAKIRYYHVPNRPVRIWMQSVPGCSYSGSGLEPGRGGVIERWVVFNDVDGVGELKLSMIDAETQDVLVKFSLPVSYKLASQESDDKKSMKITNDRLQRLEERVGILEQGKHNH